MLKLSHFYSHLKSDTRIESLSFGAIMSQGKSLKYMDSMMSVAENMAILMSGNV